MNKAPGVDFVGTIMLVELSEVISEVAAILFNKSLTTAEMYPKWGGRKQQNFFHQTARILLTSL